jgi:hypothetical protein
LDFAIYPKIHHFGFLVVLTSAGSLTPSMSKLPAWETAAVAEEAATDCTKNLASIIVASSFFLQKGNKATASASSDAHGIFIHNARSISQTCLIRKRKPYAICLATVCNH